MLGSGIGLWGESYAGGSRKERSSRNANDADVDADVFPSMAMSTLFVIIIFAVRAGKGMV